MTFDEIWQRKHQSVSDHKKEQISYGFESSLEGTQTRVKTGGKDNTEKSPPRRYEPLTLKSMFPLRTGCRDRLPGLTTDVWDNLKTTYGERSESGEDEG